MKNLVLITSVICTPNIPLSYTNNRSIHSHNDRFEQTKKTFETVREKVPNAEIFLVECSEFTREQNDFLKSNCNYYLNLIDTIHKKSVYSPSKSLGEGIMTICALECIINNNIEYDNLIKISGRYWLSERFDYTKFNNDKIVVKYINDDSNNGFTALYKLPKHEVKSLLDFLVNNMSSMYACVGYEILFASYLKTKHSVVNMNPIGLAGYVSVSNDYYDG